MPFRTEHVAPGANPPPPLSERRVLVCRTPTPGSVAGLTADEWGASIQYDPGTAGSFEHAKALAEQWASLESNRVHNLFIEDPTSA